MCCYFEHCTFWWMNECLVIEWILEYFVDVGVHLSYIIVPNNESEPKQ